MDGHLEMDWGDGPRKPGEIKVVFGGDPVDVPAWRGFCPDCERVVSCGPGVSFGPPHVCIEHQDVPNLVDCTILHVHASEDCRYWRNRMWRLWHIHTFGRVSMWWMRRRQARRLKRERESPEAWVDYWAKGGE